MYNNFHYDACMCNNFHHDICICNNLHYDTCMCNNLHHDTCILNLISPRVLLYWRDDTGDNDCMDSLMGIETWFNKESINSQHKTSDGA